MSSNSELLQSTQTMFEHSKNERDGTTTSLLQSQQSPLQNRRSAMMPSSPLFQGDYEMQTDFTNDVSHNNTTRGAQPRRKRIRRDGDALDRETSTCLVTCAGPN